MTHRPKRTDEWQCAFLALLGEDQASYDDEGTKQYSNAVIEKIV